ncbi:uroporphyrinogen-III C-methyltransferase [Micromonospora sp. 4G57]|uniref:uroporphyrinogen-III C-methyltransferase n=1 Tax=Micromonospora sicca TaxID=2202420 RepID=A0ABU5JHJ0_9ACTN|nr:MULTISPECIES: uroporphyrinogen-III C-methyltransferase [unclassified Micromonospora]MDZ5442137.1 uroporphyrinogen-III C-methyltransferase [Micromonospora sp. 4G57]MDZ5492084.1 uroporphyrinogen-III C-methyltransferase [Micromonospora sp. 4G53]
MTPDRTPLLIVGHGTRSAPGVAQFAALVDRIRRRGVVDDVEGGFIELSRPPLTDAVGALVGRGHRNLVALPLVLAAAGHGKGDIPAALAREKQRHPGLWYAYGRPLGPHPLLHEILAARIDAVLDGDDRAGTGIALIGRGSTDPDANAEVAKVARLLWEGRGYAGVEPGFISLAEPSVPAVLERLRRLGARRIVVAPYFLFAGVLPDRIVAQSDAYAADHPELDVRVADLIGDCDALADLVQERHAEALRGDIRMNCDTCAYRVALPGFADKVGRPQTPHHHPDDPAGGHGHHHHDHHHHYPGLRPGQVAIVGGGPGPDDLITVRGRALLDAADVVVTDRLAPTGLLSGLRPEVLVVDAAKVPRGPSVGQDTINDTLVAHARAGRRVVRLKGGDPYVFGRGHEEVQACAAAGVETVLVPGVSSALAAPALAGVPVTHRGVAHDVTVVSGHLPPGHPDSLVDWPALARARGTVVLLMAVDTVAKIAAVLIEHGRDPGAPVLAVQDAGLPGQRALPSRLDEVGALTVREGVRPPAVFVLGPVVALRAPARQPAARGQQPPR